MEIIYILISIYNYGLSGKLMWKKYNKKGSEIKFCFYEGEFSQLESLVEHKYNYSIINKIYEDKSAYYLLYLIHQHYMGLLLINMELLIHSNLLHLFPKKQV